MRRIPSPQARLGVRRDGSVHVAQTVLGAPLVRTRTARVALAAREEHLDRDAIAFADIPAARCVGADALDHADGLMPRDEGPAASARQVARVLLVIGPAQTARFDTEQRVVGGDVRQGELPKDEMPRALED
jgi:hypothetical protein